MPESLQSTLSTAEICTFAEIQPASADTSPGHFLDQLLATERHSEAVRFLAHALGEEAAIRWACECVKQLGNSETKERKAALEATEDWLGARDDMKRRATKEAAERSKLDTPAGALAMAAFFTGGSIAPISAPEVPPPPHICQKMAAAAVILGVVTHHPEEASQRFRRAIQLGLAMAH